MSRPTHYEALGLGREATPEQIEKAHQFFAEMYDEAGLAVYSLLDAEERREASARVSQAYEVLRDPERRASYDRGLDAGDAGPPGLAPPGPMPPAPVVAPAASLPRPPQPWRTLSEPVTGESLRQAREAAGVSLQQIAAATKIGVRFLQYIEADRHDALPAPVYIRGFVQEYARHVGLDPRRTAEAYLKGLRSD